MPKRDGWEIDLHSYLPSLSTLIFAGLVKNAGKTTAFNAINMLFPDVCLGLTSLGYDGETLDAIYHHPKPSIPVRLGQLILTAERFLPSTHKCYDILETWGSHPQFGSWLILKITEPGDFRMAGPSALSEIQKGISRLRCHGATQIHVDGALNRLSHISLETISKPEEVLSTTIILSTGAALGNTLNEITERTQYFLELFDLPAFSPSGGLSFGKLTQNTFTSSNAYFQQDDWVPLPSFLWYQDLKSLLPLQAEAVYLKGALTDSLYLALRTAGRLPRQFIVQTPAHVLLSRAVWSGLKSRGIKVKLLVRPHLAMLTLCPWHPISPISTERIAEALLPYSSVPLVDIQRRQIWLP